jgi:hypothetical protein
MLTVATAIVTHYNHSSQATAHLQQACSEILNGHHVDSDDSGFAGLEDVRDELKDVTGLFGRLRLLALVKTRWWSRYAMLLRLLQLRQALHVLSATKRVSKSM